MPPLSRHAWRFSIHRNPPPTYTSAACRPPPTAQRLDRLAEALPPLRRSRVPGRRRPPLREDQRTHSHGSRASGDGVRHPPRPARPQPALRRRPLPAPLRRPRIRSPTTTRRHTRASARPDADAVPRCFASSAWRIRTTSAPSSDRASSRPTSSNGAARWRRPSPSRTSSAAAARSPSSRSAAAPASTCSGTPTPSTTATAVAAGDPASPVRLESEVRGGTPLPPFPRDMPIASRTGIDLAPVDINDDDAVLWQRALMWPERTERQQRLEAAIPIVRAAAPRLLAGDACDLLPGVLADAPDGAPSCVFATYALYQFPPAARRPPARHHARARRHARRRLHHHGHRVRRERRWRPPPRGTALRDGEGRPDLLARCHPHGRWIAWQPE